MMGYLQLPMNIADFLSNLASGFLATVFAIPAGLWANSWLVAQTEKGKRKEEAIRLYHSLATLKEALDFNIENYEMMYQGHKNSRPGFLTKILKPL
jgi:hypothetical protein